MRLRAFVMKRLIGIAAVAIGISVVSAGSVAAAEGWQVAPVPEWVERIEPPTAASIEEPGSEGVQFLLSDSQVRVEPRAWYFHGVRKITHSNALSEHSQIQIGFDPAFESIELHSIDIYRNGKWTSRLADADVLVARREAEMDRQIFDGSRTLTVSTPDVRVGDVLRYEFTRYGSNPVLGNRVSGSFGTGWNSPLGHFRYRMIAPRDRELAFRSSPPGDEPEIRERGEFREFVWERRDLPAILWEENTPSWRSPFPYVEVSEYDSWKSVIDWALPLYRMNPDALPDEAVQFVNALPEDWDAERRAAAILDWVRERVRYLGFLDGENSHRPKSPEFTLARGYGDCKAMALLTCAMMRSAGIEANPVLVASRGGDSASKSLPSPGAFDHVIVEVVSGAARRIYVDPTDHSTRGPLAHRLIPFYGYGLPIREDADALVEIKPLESAMSCLLVSENFVIDDYDGPGTLEIRTRASGGSADYLRNHFSRNGRDQITANYHEFQTRNYPDIEVEAPIEFRDFPDENRVEILEKYRLPMPWSAGPEGGAPQFEFYPRELRAWMPAEPSGARRQPLALSWPLDHRLTSRFVLPEPWVIHDNAFVVSNRAFEFREVPSSSGNVVTFDLFFKTKAAEIPPEDFARTREDLRRIDDYLGYRFQRPAPSYVEGVVVVLLGGLGLVLSAGVGWVLVRGVGRHPPPLPGDVDPRFDGIRGWLILVAFGTFVRPVAVLAGMVQESIPFFDGTMSFAAISALLPTGKAVLFFSLMTIEMLVLPFLFGLSVVAVVLLLRRSRRFPGISIFFLLWTVGFGAYTGGFVPLVFPEFGNEASPADFVRALISAMIWVPYFLKSRRVRATFRR